MVKLVIKKARVRRSLAARVGRTRLQSAVCFRLNSSRMAHSLAVRRMP